MKELYVYFFIGGLRQIKSKQLYYNHHGMLKLMTSFEISFMKFTLLLIKYYTKNLERN